MNKPLFSVIVPVYNIEDYIGDCLLSLINQSFDDFEVVVVDDGSKDNSGSICDEYSRKDSRIRVLHKENAGVVSARKDAATYSCGEYIVCVDGDDTVSTDMLESLAKVAKEHNPDIICYGFNREIEKDNFAELKPKAKIGFYNREQMEKEIFPYLVQGSDNILGNSLANRAWRRRLFVELQAKETLELAVGEDAALSKSIVYNSSSLYVMDKCFYYYRRREDSAMTSRKSFAWNGPELMGRFLEENLDMDKFNFKQQLAADISEALFYVSISQFLQDKPYGVVRKEIVKNLNNPYYKKQLSIPVDNLGLKDKVKRFLVRHKCVLALRVFGSYINK